MIKPFKSIGQVFEAFTKIRALVVGDVMMDAYLWGRVERISPEAPVPIVHVQKRETRLGGAANVAINIQAMGATPLLCSVIGNDRTGDELLALMKNLNMNTDGMVRSDERVTTVKTRVIGNNHQLLRVDDEVTDLIDDKESNLLLKRVIEILDSNQVNVIIFEDYDKGVLNEKLIEGIVVEAKKRNIPTAVDPKKNNFLCYKNVSLFKPNLGELKSGLKVDIDKTTASNIEQSIAAFKKDHSIDTIMVTLSEAGVFFSNNGTSKIIPAHVRNISDVSGAGDTVISVAALCLALGMSSEFISALANLAGGLVCEKVGVVPIDKQQLLEEAEQLSLS